jgi:hypothetical protein
LLTATLSAPARSRPARRRGRDAAADRERDLQLGGRLLDEREHGPAPSIDAVTSRKTSSSARAPIARRELDRVADLAQASKRRLDDATARDVQARGSRAS